ncbi:MAG: sodium:calcium antiporter [Chloroflexi bacterium]|nr:sodium:calcium antiporter [Chloroflexota bacterium]
MINIIVGLLAMAILVLSSDEAVKRFVGLANYFNLSATFMGVTVLSLATSIPEISSHLTASVGILRGNLDYKIGSSIVLGANIGSDVVQQTLIMAMVCFFAGGLYFRRYFLTKSMLPMIGTTLMCIVLGLDRSYSRLDGLILFGTFIGYMYYLYWDERKYFKPEVKAEEEEDVPQSGLEALKYAAIAVVAMALTILSAQVVLQITELVVQVTGIGGSLIGVVTLGVASALPELTTAVSGVRHKEQGISLGTLVGSNITNPLVAIGGGALVSTYWVPYPLIAWDLPWETVTGAILWAILWFRRGRLTKLWSLYLAGLYFVYVILRAVYFAVD